MNKELKHRPYKELSDIILINIYEENVKINPMNYIMLSVFLSLMYLINKLFFTFYLSFVFFHLIYSYYNKTIKLNLIIEELKYRKLL